MTVACRVTWRFQPSLSPPFHGNVMHFSNIRFNLNCLLEISIKIEKRKRLDRESKILSVPMEECANVCSPSWPTFIRGAVCTFPLSVPFKIFIHFIILQILLALSSAACYFKRFGSFELIFILPPPWCWSATHHSCEFLSHQHRMYGVFLTIIYLANAFIQKLVSKQGTITPGVV